MLILIAGITGNIGVKLLSALTQRGHAVRGLSRSKDKLSEKDLQSLEGFYELSSWYDVDAIRKSLRGVDAVVCAYSPVPVLALDAQVLLVRIMEEEGVTRFIPSTWNADWSVLHWGDVPYYDLFLALQRQIAMSTTIEPIYIFVGIFHEVFFSKPGHGGFGPDSHGVWDPNGPVKRAEVWGTGDEKWQLTTEEDCAEFTAELLVDLSKKAGYYRFCSGEYSSREIANIYAQERGVQVNLDFKGSIEQLRATAEKAKREMGLGRFFEWGGYYFQLIQLDGTVYMERLDLKLYPWLKRTSLVEFLREHQEV
ncbi:NAD(P)-binding protein [Rhizodiscina lignyota]|uniref:NAD(P)-binding protein n=1 Tax=Rhizodiscina lignyota TaxID=1504668 RepID=A0A9P4IGL4_9PEZI|nr:NAD(P)-binding protein [Rhizodiscina lignyota]